MSRLADAPAYLFVSEISREETTVIARVVHESSGEEFAVKFPQNECDQTAFEAEVLQRLDDETVIELVEVFPTDEGPALVLPFAAGGDVYSAIERRGRLKESDARTVMAALLTALAHCHERGVWHRDVKPENLFLMTESFDSAVLGDFGYAIDTTQTPFDWRFLGSPPFAAPEIWQQIVYSEKVDIWSGGVTLFVMVDGRFPYPLAKGMEVQCIAESMAALHSEDALPAVSPQCKDLLFRMLDMNPETRISAQDALAHAWFTSPITEITQNDWSDD
jgi:calcium-dependent protein kinase